MELPSHITERVVLVVEQLLVGLTIVVPNVDVLFRESWPPPLVLLPFLSESSANCDRKQVKPVLIIKQKQKKENVELAK